MPLSTDSPSAADGIMLFGVRMNVFDPMRKSVSMNNLSEYEPVSNTSNLGKELPEAEKESAGGGGYASANDAVAQPSGGRAERKRGTPWTEEEHKLFLVGLQNVGKGDWKGISRNYMKTRTPTQVASHAQKYFLRRSNISRRRRRSSLFDMTTDSVSAMPMEEAKKCEEIRSEGVTQPAPVPSNAYLFSAMRFPVTIAPVMLSSLMLLHHVPVLSMHPSSEMANLKLNQQVRPQPSLGMSLSIGQNQTSGRGESIVSVA